MSRPIRTLLFSSLYPSEVRPLHGIFVETRLRELLKTGQVETRVVAPVPWFPFKGKRFGEYGLFAATPKHEIRSGIQIHHPRYALPPKIGMNIAPYLMARGALPAIRRMMAQGFDFDLIDAHYYYPDGVAAGLIARKLGKPFVVTARGTDLNVVSDYPLPRRLILNTANRSAASIGVCRALMDKLGELGADPGKCHVFRNGVDLVRFRPEPQDEARSRLGLPQGRMLLSVGRLAEGKGHEIAIKSLRGLPAIRLYLLGHGSQRDRLQQLAKAEGVADRVIFVGSVPNEELRWWYSASDILVLASSREGWANVLLESMACGTPVVASDIPGTREVLESNTAGIFMRERTPESLAEAVEGLFARYPVRDQVRRYAEAFSWDSTSQAQVELFDRIARCPR